MLVQLDAAFLGLKPKEFAAYDGFIEYLVLRHADRRILFAASPALLSKTRRDIQLGPVARAVISIMEKRSQDYCAFAPKLRCILRVVPDNCAVAEKIDKDNFIAGSERAKEIIECRSRLFVENADNDGAFYQFLIECFLEIKGLPSALTFPEVLHGGGSSLSKAMMNLGDKKLVGLCICDRDSSGVAPPFQVYTTGYHALEVALATGVMTKGPDIEPTHPFFDLIATAGWSVENYLGPNLLSVFFDNHPGCGTERMRFLNAFPDFPTVSNDDLLGWFAGNLKKQQAAKELEDAVARLGMNRHQPSLEHISRLAVPANALSWILLNRRGTRFSQDIRSAIRNDVKMPFYHWAIEELAKRYVTMFAADSRMALA